jgi:hypothetical protein
MDFRNPTIGLRRAAEDTQSLQERTVIRVNLNVSRNSQHAGHGQADHARRTSTDEILPA